MKQYKSCSHILHLIMCLLTGGFWIVVWIMCALRVSAYNKTIDYSLQKEILVQLKRKSL